MAPNTSPIWDQLRNHHPREYKDHLLAAVKAKENDKKRKSNDDEEANEMEHKSLADKRAKGDTQTTLSGWMQSPVDLAQVFTPSMIRGPRRDTEASWL